MAVLKVVKSRAMRLQMRIGAVEAFLRDYPTDNPHRETAQGYLTELRAGREPIDGDMVRVAAGAFFMGCNERVESGCSSHEKPGRTVWVKAFLIDRTEVTVAAYRKCVEAGGCSPEGLSTAFWKGRAQPSYSEYCNWGKPGRDGHPINCANWEHARRYCAWADKRLPTDEEWEKAARGTDGRKYPWGNVVSGTTT